MQAFAQTRLGTGGARGRGLALSLAFFLILVTAGAVLALARKSDLLGPIAPGQSCGLGQLFGCLLSLRPVVPSSIGRTDRLETCWRSSPCRWKGVVATKAWRIG